MNCFIDDSSPTGTHQPGRESKPAVSATRSPPPLDDRAESDRDVGGSRASTRSSVETPPGWAEYKVYWTGSTWERPRSQTWITTTTANNWVIRFETAMGPPQRQILLPRIQSQ